MSDYEWDCDYECGFGSDSALVVSEHHETCRFSPLPSADLAWLRIEAAGEGLLAGSITAIERCARLASRVEAAESELDKAQDMAGALIAAIRLLPDDERDAVLNQAGVTMARS